MDDSIDTAIDPATEAVNREQRALATGLKEQVSRAVIGQSEVIDQLLVCLIAGGHVLLEGLPGLGKTLLGRAVAATFGGRFSRVQFTPDLMPADVTGHAVFNPKEGKFVIRRGPIFTNMLLADEINRAPAKTQASLLEVMQEYQATLEGRSHPVPSPFMVIATQNPIEMEGTYPLPEAQLDRFLMLVSVDYPDQMAEEELVAKVTRAQSGEALNLSDVQQIMSPEQMLRLQQTASQLNVEKRIVDYAVAMARHSREMPGVTSGASPRAAIGLVRVARAAALLDGRNYVVPDDVKRFAPAVLRHRIKLTAEYEIEGRTRAELVDELLHQVPAPRK